jgi:hypothetical protein
MGTTGAMGMADAVNDGSVSLRAALSWHLTSNHFPPLPSAWVESALKVIDHANEGDWESMVTLPEAGRFSEQSYSVGELVDRFHLDAFIEADLEGEEYETW